MNVLIVDDEQIFIDTLIKKISWTRFGFSAIFTALSISDGLRIMQGHNIHLLLCDIEMPRGNGLELFEQVKLYYPLTECIFVTCHDDYHYLRRALQLGSFDYVLKPIDYQEFDIVLQTVVDRIKKNQTLCYCKSGLANFDKKHTESGNEYVEKMIYYIRDHIQEPFSITDISNAVHLNSQYAMRLFKKHMNQSILAYITEQRIKLAKKILASTDLSVSSVAASVGINHPSYFIKLFKKTTGKTPKEFRFSSNSNQSSDLTAPPHP